MNKKLNFKHNGLATSLLLILAAIALLHSCKKENFAQQKLNHLSAIRQNDTLESIPYESFIKSIDIEKTGVLKQALLNKGKQTKQINSVDAEIIDGFEIDMTTVKKLNLGDTTSYVVSFVPQTPRATHFENLTIQVVNGNTKAFITTYFPTQEWIEDWSTVKHLSFKGDTYVNFINLDSVSSKLKINSVQSNEHSIRLNNKKINLLPGECEFIDVYELVPYQCSTGDWPGYCAWESNITSMGQLDWLPGYRMERYSIINCAMPSGSTGGGTGGGSGGGGSTSPTPPSTYNPCNSGPVAVSSTKNGLKLNLVNPSDCDQNNNPPTSTRPPTDAVILNQIKDRPFTFYDIPCEVIRQWLSTAKFKPDNTIIGKLNNVVVKATTSLGSGAPGFTSTDIAHVQKIDDAYSAVVNMDYFPITINQLPIVNGQRLTADQLLQYVRLNINSFINDNKTFIPYNYGGIDDRAKWASNDPKGALVVIDLAGPDNATVVTSYYANNKWTFTTIYDPIYAGEHPVSGNRNFGYTANSDGTYTFYTRGVDRLTSADGVLVQTIPDFFKSGSGIPFSMADNLWTSFQSGIKNFVMSHGGTAQIAKKEIYRPNWDLVKDVLQGRKPLSTLSKNCIED